MPHPLTILFHAPCLDGIVSAILARDLLRAPGAVLVPMSYAVRATWLHAPPVSTDFAVVDFLFHPGAVFWADHHPTAFLSQDARSQFQDRHARFPDKYLYDPGSPSCASLIWASFSSVLPPDRGHLVRGATTTDSAAYRDPEEALFGEAGHLVVNRALSTLAVEDRGKLVELLETLASGGFDAGARLPWIGKRCQEVDARTRAALGELRTALVPNFRLVAFEWQASTGPLNRYLPWALDPDADYSVVRIRGAGRGQDKLTAMRNPWKPPGELHLGNLLQEFGGGGHQRVGSALVPSVEAASAFEQIQYRLLVGTAE